jgi:Asp/Glu/hydantoin racemase
MRPLMLDLNASQSVTDLIAATARAAAAPGTEVVLTTAPRGVPYVASRAEAVMGGAVATETLAAHHAAAGAAVIAAFAQAMEPWCRECVGWHGLERRCAGVRALGGAFRHIGAVQQEKEAPLVEPAGRAVEDDRADVAILAGAPLAGLAARVAERIPVPVVDCVAAAVEQAEALVALRPRKAARGSHRRPDAKDSTGLDPTLADWIAHRPPP